MAAAGQAGLVVTRGGAIWSRILFDHVRLLSKSAGIAIRADPRLRAMNHREQCSKHPMQVALGRLGRVHLCLDEYLGGGDLSGDLICRWVIAALKSS
jgi:hypothetical protein